MYKKTFLIVVANLHIFLLFSYNIVQNVIKLILPHRWKWIFRTVIFNISNHNLLCLTCLHTVQCIIILSYFVRVVVAICCWGELNLKSRYCEDWRHPLYKRVCPVCNIELFLFFIFRICWCGSTEARTIKSVHLWQHVN